MTAAVSRAKAGSVCLRACCRISYGLCSLFSGLVSGSSDIRCALSLPVWQFPGPRREGARSLQRLQISRGSCEAGGLGDRVGSVAVGGSDGIMSGSVG